MPDLAVKSRTKLRFRFSRCWHGALKFRPRTAHVSPARLVRAHSSFFVVCSLATAPSSPKPDSAFAHSLLCPRLAGELHRGAAYTVPTIQLCLVLHVSSYKDPACRDCPSTPLSGMLGQRRSGRCQGCSGLESSKGIRRYW